MLLKYLFFGFFVCLFVGWLVLFVCLDFARAMLLSLCVGKSRMVHQFQEKLTSFLLFHQIILLMMSYPALALTNYGMTTIFP